MHEAYMKLWSAVLRQALRDAGGAMFKETALEWIRGETHQVGSFLWVCMILEIEPGRIRRKVFKEDKGKPAQFQVPRTRMGGSAQPYAERWPQIPARPSAA